MLHGLDGTATFVLHGTVLYMSTIADKATKMQDTDNPLAQPGRS